MAGNMLHALHLSAAAPHRGSRALHPFPGLVRRGTSPAGAGIPAGARHAADGADPAPPDPESLTCLEEFPQSSRGHGSSLRNPLPRLYHR